MVIPKSRPAQTVATSDCMIGKFSAPMSHMGIMNNAASAPKPMANRVPMNARIDMNDMKSGGGRSIPCSQSIRNNGGATVNSL